MSCVVIFMLFQFSIHLLFIIFQPCIIMYVGGAEVLCLWPLPSKGQEGRQNENKQFVGQGSSNEGQCISSSLRGETRTKVMAQIDKKARLVFLLFNILYFVSVTNQYYTCVSCYTTWLRFFADVGSWNAWCRNI